LWAYPALQGSIGLLERPSPDGHPDFVAAIASARSSIEMTMYHLTDEGVVQALAQAASRQVSTRVILDVKTQKNAKSASMIEVLKNAGAQVELSSSAFSLTHMKAMVIDQQVAYVTSINLTKITDVTRDLGVVTTDPGVIQEMQSVFEADWINAQKNTADTPALQNPNLIWSPVNSESRLLDLINSAQRSIITTVENFDRDSILMALSQATARGVSVRMIVPECDANPNPFLNFDASRRLDQAGGQVRMMPSPASPLMPYMHLKMIEVDDQTVYIGSVNFSSNSLLASRELGIIFPDLTTASRVKTIFESDWASAVEVPATNPSTCPQPF